MTPLFRKVSPTHRVAQRAEPTPETPLMSVHTMAKLRRSLPPQRYPRTASR